MRKSPMIYSLFGISVMLNGQTKSETYLNGKWVPARPLGYYSLGFRLKCAWLAFTGRCDLIQWPEGQ